MAKRDTLSNREPGFMRERLVDFNAVGLASTPPGAPCPAAGGPCPAAESGVARGGARGSPAVRKGPDGGLESGSADPQPREHLNKTDKISRIGQSREYKNVAVWQQRQGI